MLRFSPVNDCLGVVESEESGQAQTTPEPHIEQASRGGVESAGDTDEKHTRAGDTQGATPVEELFTWGHVCDSTEGCHRQTRSQGSISGSSDAVSLDKWDN